MITTPNVPASRFTGAALHAAALLRSRQWDSRAIDPEGVQRRTLRWLCRSAAATELGRAHGLRECATYEDFRRAVPIREYADFLPWLERMRAGARDVLWP